MFTHDHKSLQISNTYINRITACITNATRRGEYINFTIYIHFIEEVLQFYLTVCTNNRWWICVQRNGYWCTNSSIVVVFENASGFKYPDHLWV